VYYSPHNGVVIESTVASPFRPGPEKQAKSDGAAAVRRERFANVPTLVQIVGWEIKGFLIALAAMVAGQLLTGEINTRNLLHGRINDTGKPIRDSNGVIKRKPSDTSYFSPERVQLLLLTLGAAFYYLTQVLNNPRPGTLPPVPNSWTETLAGSNLIYLRGKAISRFWPWSKNE